MNKSRTCLMLLLFILVIGNTLLSQVKTKEIYELKYKNKLQEYEYFVKTLMKFDRIPALSVAFFKGDFVWSKGFGESDIENSSKATSESAYRLASVTKPMTATAILQLYEQGKIDLDEQVQTYVPYFPEKKWPITIRQLLGHLGGITHYKNYDEEGHFKDEKNTHESIAVFKDFDLVAEPGSKYNYTSYGYNLLGAVIEEVSEQSYADYMKEHIWDPLMMNNTRMDNPLDLIKGRVSGYQMVHGKVKNSEFVNISSRFAAGGTRSTVNDMIKFAYGLISNRLLDKTSTEMMFRPMTTTDGISTGYGMGWAVSPVNGRFCIMHSGGQPETSILLVIFPKDTMAMAFACNLEGANRYPYMEKLYQLIMDEPYKITPYLRSKENYLIYSCMEKVYNYGLSTYKMFEPEKYTGEDHFNFFNQCIEDIRENVDEKDLLQRIKNGISPAENNYFIKLGVFMAQYLNKTNGLDKYHQRGAIPFFTDFIEFYRNETDWPDDRRFNEFFETLVQEWNKDWQVTLNDFTMKLYISPAENLDMVWSTLFEQFKKKKVFPDYGKQITQTVQQLCYQNMFMEAQDIGTITMELYPKSAIVHMAFCNTLLWFRDVDIANEFYKKTNEIDFQEVLSVENFSREAQRFRRWGKLREGVDLINIAIKMHPKAAKLYSRLGDFHFDMNNFSKARQNYKKALKFDPDLEYAKRQIEKIKSRTN